MNKVKNILFVGVGGQGIILASKILSEGLINAGYDTKMSEVHGMAQRGGSVTTQIRYGEKVYSPIIGKGQADIIVAFEKMEALRWLELLKPSGKVVVNDYAIASAPILIGAAKYPENVEDQLQNAVGQESVAIVNAAEIAKELGNIKVQNIVLLGCLIKAIGLEGIPWNEVISKNVKSQYIEINEKAIKVGMQQVK